MVMIRDFSPSSYEFRTKFGKQLGAGAYRTVYPFGKDLVVKFDSWGRSNRDEWAVWQHCKDTELARYLCPILARSHDGLTLIQPRVTPLEIRERAIRRKISNTSDDKSYARLLSERDALQEQAYEWRKELRRAFSAHNYDALDIHDQNIGYDRAGNLVVLDYGNFHIPNVTT